MRKFWKYYLLIFILSYSGWLVKPFILGNEWSFTYAELMLAFVENMLVTAFPTFFIYLALGYSGKEPTEYKKESGRNTTSNE